MMTFNLGKVLPAELLRRNVSYGACCWQASEQLHNLGQCLSDQTKAAYVALLSFSHLVSQAVALFYSL